MVSRLLLAALLVAVQAVSDGHGSPACDRPEGRAGCTRVLFIGNSYTSVNDLPATFAALAASGGRPVATDMAVEGSWSLARHDGDGGTAWKLGSRRWDVVVLQEQSETPAVSQVRQRLMYPPARDLIRRVRARGATPVLFLTWAHRGGYPEAGLPDYETMQSAVDAGYLAIAREQHVAVAPVGPAWQALLGGDPAADLWQEDGSHPTPEGTYLAACVFYATVFHRDPRGLPYHGAAAEGDAARLQRVAGQVVLGDQARWGIGPQGERPPGAVA